ncbi:ABC transporter ATP-binding protein [Compostimonas suwonensis]|uniref:Energy-coupling factor transport system ATP-binding protein n=1 Tax=Compostimonas suwonensis TaxID=1048394 RepID=A0A2M9BZL8_9MICO|nr:ABC transporter ATP-binding protein [Compostimonas suwonensis]PJJ63537.1 energy-coupling factor transport system ATP-binding protein [Compostimonas suwonensis]
MSTSARYASGGATGGATIRARGWGWRHAGRLAWAVSDLDLHVEAGERLLLLGASGAGKSTLVHALAGVAGGEDEGEQRGELLVDGLDPVATRGRTGLLLQDPDSQVILERVGDDVAFGCENLGLERSVIWQRVRESLDAVGLNLPLDHPTSRLSGGQKQRLALAGVLAMRPGLLVLDEPTANLDPSGVVEVRDAVARVLETSQTTLVVIEHRVAVWQHLVDRVVVLAPGGGLLADGSPAEVLHRQGAALAASGVWVPGFPPSSRLPARVPPADRVGSAGSAAGTSGALLEARDLAVGRAGAVAASGIGLTIGSGRSLAIVGPNGAGKTTLALTLAGLLPPLGGSLEASAGFAPARSAQPIRWKSAELLTRIGTVFQDPEHQFLTASVERELALGLTALRWSPADKQRRVEELLQRLHLDTLARANPFTLSGGEKRRLSVATMLAASPRLLVLDEPTFGQDATTWAELVALLGALVDEGTALVTVTHDAELVEALADERYELGASSAMTRDGERLV